MSTVASALYDLSDGMPAAMCELWNAIAEADAAETSDGILRLTRPIEELAPAWLRPLESGRRARLRQRRTRTAVAGAVVVAAVIAATLFGFRSAPSKPVQLQANSIAVIDPESARVVADIPVGFFPHGIVASAERVWALNVEDDTASAVDPQTLRVVRTFGLQGIPSDQWASGNIDWVAESGSVQRLSQTLPSRADVKTIKLGSRHPRATAERPSPARPARPAR